MIIRWLNGYGSLKSQNPEDLPKKCFHNYISDFISQFAEIKTNIGGEDFRNCNMIFPMKDRVFKNFLNGG